MSWMKNEKSYSELVKAHASNKSKTTSTIQELIIEMIIHEAILINKRKKLEQQIDHALDTQNKSLFLQLSNEMKQLMKRFGT